MTPSPNHLPGVTKGKTPATLGYQFDSLSVRLRERTHLVYDSGIRANLRFHTSTTSPQGLDIISRRRFYNFDDAAAGYTNPGFILL
jgi:hypothetical protein